MASHRPWPEMGELDIIEGVNLKITTILRSIQGCEIINGGDFTGTVDTYNCYVYAPDQHKNIGCKIIANQPNAYGSIFNDEGGGIYAVEWTSTAINVWFLRRRLIPSDIAYCRTENQHYVTYGPRPVVVILCIHASFACTVGAQGPGLPRAIRYVLT
ncbi:hypothetical protein PCL_10518 [Purpureocillium lilacinum]|uniref:Uncharacterized protein n=1 Tax=Purpureocillium lilacinum TaxID=33203 RepID=A0A2U3DQ50_PURLI|nr:hypothetical protein PCL_10518 [Purpureocillium lilacinum]